jgi:hypothetical protein
MYLEFRLQLPPKLVSPPRPELAAWKHGFSIDSDAVRCSQPARGTR